MERAPETFIFEVVWDEKERRKRVQLKSDAYFNHFLQRARVGDRGTITVSFKKPTRSQQQLRYYWILVSLLAPHCGYSLDEMDATLTDEEMHDALMRRKFGTKRVMVGGEVETVRRSIANRAGFPKAEMAELIEYVLELCRENGVVVPSMEELGYIRG